MAITKTPQQEPFPLRATEELQPAVGRYAPLPTAADLKNKKLFGIPLKSSLTGETLSDEALDYYINAAISELEHDLNINITPVQHYEKHDYDRHDFTWNYNYVKVDHSPVLYVEKVELSFSNDPNVSGFVNFPLEFVHVMGQEGTIQLVPAFGTSISGFLMSAFAGAQFHALRAAGITNFPGAIRIQYVAGFAPDKIPYAIVELIQVIAALNALSILGPILFPHNSVSIGIDGTSQSVGGLGPRHFMDRIDQLTKERDRLLDTVRGYYQRKFLHDFF